ncbi:adenylyltransferase and sulfurtransferase MOCS3 [Tribolium castaneum]|uniref:Adenylyltransferase and sulfurtransferase MOCS3 homolog n=1 Tax=Tribolium castaneum TaxID=7070 RepID=D6WAP4_TRICA|nr:PREDICTED: adenylyltransferase and sulfurtransferase MOCS3 [Tribolium castaneum]EEZ98663.1 Adenylyltransferase and sulfurtransferase MOCS3-like Protein [Tribolium castaneum]|eukprot:XP_975084.1 PREDICTED: adenylyltransferase and sulfurtransferase MOCS3 [Tribolium castaneum]
MSNLEIKTLEAEIAALERTLDEKKFRLQQLKSEHVSCPYSDVLSSEEIVRYSRQIIMPQICKSGQIKLKESKILIVGAGGLGCPASLYLAAAGVGEIHIVDYDEVELSNLHRQILHYEHDIGLPKVQSASEKLKRLNSNIKIVPLHIHAFSSITDFVQKNKYDAVLDCTDNAPTRYLLNDICVIHNIPLVSGSALQMEGQLTVYHYNNGPCYRCLFPKPPPAHTVTNCGDGGVLGSVCGVIGVLQALETVKILTQMEGVLSGRLLIFDGSETTFRNVKLRQRVTTCEVCGDNPKIKEPVDYEQFCGARAHDKVVNINILESEENVTVEQLRGVLDGNNIVIDVRSELEFDMCRLPNTVNLPYAKIRDNKSLGELEGLVKRAREGNKNVYLLCRRGNDSQRATSYLRQNFSNTSVRFWNVKGGLHAYSKSIDPTFPVY